MDALASTELYAGEFRAIKYDIPEAGIKFLSHVTLVYGFILFFFLPYTLASTMMNDPKLASWGVVGVIWGALIFCLGIATMLRWCIVQTLAFAEHTKANKLQPLSDDEAPLVSILVPAFNESDCIEAALRSLVDLDYPRYEVIVVDDGSDDDTYARALNFAGEYPHCTLAVHTKPNGGKWSALNFAFHRAKGDALLCVDADSRLSSDALRMLVPHLKNPQIAAVCGQVTIRNRSRLLTRFQAVEYCLSNGGSRMALSRLGLVTVVPGPIGLYRREVMEEIASLPMNQRQVTSHGEDAGKVYGPLSGQTFAEDFQLSLTALSRGWKIVYEPRAFAYTKAPDQMDVLLSQRYRWMRGTWQVVNLYTREMANYSRHNWRLNAAMLFLYSIDVLIVPPLNFLFYVSLSLAIMFGATPEGFIIWTLCTTIMNLMTGFIYFSVQKDELTLLPLVVFVDFYQALLVNSAWFISTLDELRGSRMKWHA